MRKDSGMSSPETFEFGQCRRLAFINPWRVEDRLIQVHEIHLYPGLSKYMGHGMSHDTGTNHHRTLYIIVIYLLSPNWIDY